MPSSEQNALPRAAPGRRLSVFPSAFARFLPIVCLFATFPLALFRPIHTGLPLLFHVALPTRLWLGLLAVVLLIFLPLSPISKGLIGRLPPRKSALYSAGMAGILFAIILSAIHGGVHGLAPVVAATSFFAVPAYLALCPRSFLPRRLAWILGLLWLVQAVHGLWQFGVGTEVVGLTGNRNWMAAMLLALAPWPMLVATECRRQERGRSDRLSPRTVLGCVLPPLITLVLLWQCASRAAWLVLCCYAVFYMVLPRFSTWPRVLLLAGLAVLGAAALYLAADTIGDQWRRDIRPPLWRQTALMITDHPFLGVGPGNFRRAFELYKSPAQRGRPDIAPVTEHPHNEILHLAATLGVPLALLWCILATVPLLRRPGGRFQGGLHFSACTIIGCALFDKTLVQAPTAILGLICLGLLWRRRQHRRLQPHAAGPRRRLFLLLTAPAAVAIGVFWGMRATGVGWLFRAAYIAEAEHNYTRAFAAYRAAGRLDPGNIRTHFLAGDLAVNKLRNPKLALPPLRRTYTMDPNFAHVNRDLGLTLGLLGRNTDARVFFEREVALYPFDPIAFRNLYVCALGTGDYATARRAMGEWVDAILHRLHQRLGPVQFRTAAVEWARAVQRGDAKTAIDRARKLLARSAATGAAPPFYRLCQRSGVPRALAAADFSMADAVRWHALWRTRQVVRRNRLTSVPALQRFVSAEIRATVRDGEHRPPDAATYELLGLAHQAGMATALVRSKANDTPGPILLHDGEKAWLLWPSTRAWLCAPDTTELLATPEVGADVTDILVPASPLDFCLRTQVLGRVLRRTLGPTAPTLGDSPTLRRQTWRELLDATQEPRGKSTNSQLKMNVDFDLGLFTDFAKRWRVRAVPVTRSAEVSPSP